MPGSSLDLCREVLGEELSPDSISHALSDPEAFLDRISTVRNSQELQSDLPPLEPGEHRPLLWNWNRWPIQSFRQAEAGLDKLTAALLHAHRAVIFDPLAVLCDTFTLRSERDYLRDKLAATLHYLVWAEPLIDQGTLFLREPICDRGKSWSSGPWPRMRRRGLVKNPLWGLLDRLMGTDQQEREMRYSVQAEWRAATMNMMRQRVSYLNRLDGLAHLYGAYHPHIDDSDDWWDEDGAIGYINSRALAIRLVQSLRITSVPSIDIPVNERRLSILLRSPVPDLSIVTARDLVVIREANEFGTWRHELSRYLDEYERAGAAGESLVARDIAAELRSRATELELAAAASSSLAAVKGGIATLTLGLGAAAAAAPLIGFSNFGKEIAVVASTTLVDTLRRLRRAQHEASRTAYVEARASIARAAAERFDHL